MTIPYALATGIALLTGATAAVAAQDLPHTLQSPNGQLFGSFGLAVASAGDVNGDGRADVIVGADGENGPTGGFAGRAYIFDGSTGHVIHELESPAHQSGSYFGTSVAGIGDVDGDGRSDVLVGARAAVVPSGAPSGRAFVYSGATGALVRDFQSPAAQAGSNFGAAVAGAGDVDGDGLPDVLISAEGENTSSGDDAGRAYVFSGANGALLHTIESPSAQPGGLFAHSLAGLVDVDGDGCNDFAVGAVNEHDGNLVRGGRVHVFSGATGAPLFSLDSPHTQASGRFGLAVAGAGDIDADGGGDVLVGAPGEQPAGANSGRAYLFSGTSGVMMREFVSPNAEQTGFFGGAVAGAGDLDNDGRADVVIGGAGEDTPSGFGAGRAYAFSGATGATLFSMESPNGQQAGVFGTALASAGDVDGDGLPELLVGAMGEDTPEGNSAGRAYVLPVPVATAGAPAPGGRGLFLAVAPNPSPGTAIARYALPDAGVVRLVVTDVLGREVARLVDGQRPAGAGEASVAGLPAGVYVLGLTAAGTKSTARFVVVR